MTGSVQKNDIVDRLIGMVKIGVMHKFSDDYSDDAYMIVKQVWLFHIRITDDITHFLKGQPRSASVIEWDK